MAGVNLTAATVALSAQTGIGTNGALRLAATTIGATNASGDINLANAAGGCLYGLIWRWRLPDGAGAITFSQQAGR